MVILPKFFYVKVVKNVILIIYLNNICNFA